MALGEDGVPIIDELACVGCGLCVARCPVGAISLEPDTGLADIEDDDQGAFVSAPYEPSAFAAHRNRIASLLIPEEVPYSDAQLVQVQIDRLSAFAVPVALQRVYRLLARNAFLSLGLSARLKNPGDNNAFAELAIGSEATLVLVEVEPNGDVLDAFRRVISGVAVVRNRYKVGEADVIPCVVMDRLPNVRVDYYEAVKNARDRIGVSVRSLPAASLLLGIRSSDHRLLQLIRELAVLDSLRPSMEDQASALWGPVHGAGLSPAK
jgi:ferredoxin